MEQRPALPREKAGGGKLEATPLACTFPTQRARVLLFVRLPSVSNLASIIAQSGN